MGPKPKLCLTERNEHAWLPSVRLKYSPRRESSSYAPLRIHALAVGIFRPHPPHGPVGLGLLRRLGLIRFVKLPAGGKLLPRQIPLMLGTLVRLVGFVRLSMAK